MKKLSLPEYAAAAAATKLAESLLIIAGLLPAMLSYSPVNLAFSAFILLIAVHSGAAFAKSLKKAALAGATIGAASSSIAVAMSLIGKYTFSTPVLGVSAPQDAMALIMLVLILENSALGLVVATLSGWVSNRFFSKKPSKRHRTA